MLAAVNLAFKLLGAHNNPSSIKSVIIEGLFSIASMFSLIVTLASLLSTNWIRYSLHTSSKVNPWLLLSLIIFLASVGSTKTYLSL